MGGRMAQDMRETEEYIGFEVDWNKLDNFINEIEFDGEEHTYKGKPVSELMEHYMRFVAA
jgi:hypothetical protein